MAQFIVGLGDITNPLTWQDVFGAQSVPPSEFQAVPGNTNFPLNGDGRYWFTGNAFSPKGNTKSLLHFDGTDGATTFPDSSANAIVFTPQGAAQLSTTLPEFGTASLVLDGVAASISAPLVAGSPLDLSVGNADWTVEFWVKMTTVASFYGLVDYTGVVFGEGFRITVTAGVLELKTFKNVGNWASFSAIDHQTALTDGVWHHVAAVRSGTNLNIYLDGVKDNVGSVIIASQPQTPGTLYVGQAVNVTGFVPGNIDEFRISGVARYTANFAPPGTPFSVDPSPSTFKFIGDPVLRVTGNMALEWQITQYSTDGSAPFLQYSLDNGATFTSTQLGGGNAPQSGAINLSLAGATGILVGMQYLGGTQVIGAPQTTVALAITRNVNQSPIFDTPNPFDPINYNAQKLDLTGYPSQTLAQLRTRILIGLGFSAQAASPPPSMAAFVNDKLLGAQNYLYRRYTALHTRRFFRWKLIPGQRYYSLKDNDEDVLSTYHMDPAKTIEWVGIQDTRNVWYPLIQGIPPQLYTMISKPWRPARYDIRQAIEVYPAPDQTYWLWMRANFGLMSFTADSDQTTIDSELVYLHALANAKAHYGQADANNIEAQANTYRGELIAGTHQTAHYVPGTIAVPPAVRPTLIQYQDNQGG